MGRIGVDDYENYGNGSGTNFFSLRDDGEVATVRFMYRDAKDIVGYAAHKVKIGDRDRFVNCLREYNEPVDKCPFCRAHMFQTVKLYVPVYNSRHRRLTGSPTKFKRRCSIHGTFWR